MSIQWVRDDIYKGITVGVGTDAEYGTPVVWHPYYSLDHCEDEGSWTVWCSCELVRPSRHLVAAADPVADPAWRLWPIAWSVVTLESRRRIRPSHGRSTLDVVVALICHGLPGRPVDQEALAAVQLMYGLGVTNPLDLFLIYSDGISQSLAPRA